MRPYITCGMHKGKPPTGIHCYRGTVCKGWRFMVSAFGFAPYIDVGVTHANR